jgi:hypothetical protein
MKDNRILQGVIGLLALALIVYVGAQTRNALQQYAYIGKSGRDTITINGEGKVSAKPDIATVSLGVQTDGATVKDTQTQNTTKMNAIIAAIKALKVEDKDIQTSNYNIYPRYDYSNGRQNIIGYSVSQNVEVKVRNLDGVGDVLAKAGELGANQVGGVQFTIDDPKALQADARLKALADARKKADDVSAQLGLTVVKVVTFSESSGNVSPPIMYDAMKSLAGAVPAPSPTIEAGSLDVTSDVSVTFEVK